MMKIIATVGPASDSMEVLRNFSKTTKLFRLNGSHNTLMWHQKIAKKIRKVCPDALILMDIPGVKPRTNNKVAVEIQAGQDVVFGSSNSSDSRLCIELTRHLPKLVAFQTQFSVSDGQFIFELLETGENFVVGRSRSTFNLLPKKGINIPSSVYDEEKQLQIYSEFINSVAEIDIDALGLSFVQTGALVHSVRKLAPELILVSKVENSEGLKGCSEIIEASDAVMIDRGDLAAEIGLEDLYEAVEHIVSETKSSGKPLIMATENLESMLDREVPSKSEVISIAHSRAIGADCIMLSEETATAENGLHTLTWLDQFLRKLGGSKRDKARARANTHFPEIWEMLQYVDDMPVILMSKAGHAVFDFFAVRPDGTLSLVTNNIKLQKLAHLFAQDIHVFSEDLSSNLPIETIWGVIGKNKEVLFQKMTVQGNFVSIYVSSARANSITIFHKSDF